MNSIYIYGASGHGFVVADIARACGYDNIIFVDDGDNKHVSFDSIHQNNNIPLVLGIGSNELRSKLFYKAQTYGFELKTLIHPHTVLSSSSFIEEGTVVMPNVVINANAKIGKGVILNTSCVVEHDNIISDFVHLSPNVALAGGVSVLENTHIGINSCIIQGTSVGRNCIVGAGSVVVKNIENNKLAFGNPCKVIKEING